MRRAHAFLGNFALPLVAGGALPVSRPIRPKDFEGLSKELSTLPSELSQLAELAKQRWYIARALWPAMPPPTLDDATLRLAVAVHNLLALGHPAMNGASSRARDQVIGFATDLAKLGPPATAASALERHSMLSRLGDIERNEHEVHNWLGTRTFVGQLPPRRLLRWPKLRKIQVAHQKRSWLRDIGVPNDARRLWEALGQANPLMEALNPGRLDPPLSWDNLFEVLRFAPLARGVAAHLVEQGLAVVAEPMAIALFAQGSLKEGIRPTATRQSIAFGVTFLVHLYWLAIFTRAPCDVGPAMAALLAAAALEPTLVLPHDVRNAHQLSASVDAFMVRLRAHRLREGGVFVQEARSTVALARLSPAPMFL